MLCSSFLQQYIQQDYCVIDVGAGFCGFINNINCKKKYAVDLNKDTAAYANADVIVLKDLSVIFNESADIVFMSNFLEHLPSKNDLLHMLNEAHRILRKSGRIMLLQPNIRYAYKEYWDFFDHHIPLSDKSLAEAISLAGFSVNIIIPRFLPYSTKNKMPQWEYFLKLYLRFSFLWKFFGKQCFVMGDKVG